MRHLKNIVLLAAATAATACASVNLPPASSPDLAQVCSSTAKSLVGKEYSEAVKQSLVGQGLLVRVFQKGVSSPMTMDFRVERLNLTLDNGVIVAARCG